MSKKKIHCEINGEKLQVEEGTSIISAFKNNNKEICHYCWHPGLSVAGACRLCMVEIEGRPKLEIACNTKIQEGMKINNQSDKVKEAVRWGLEYHLINHPLDCPICDQAGECELQDQYMKFGSYDSSMAEAKVKKRKVVNLGRDIVLDTERCILCSRCVRFTEEVTKTHELGIFNRGDHSEIGVFKDKPLNNNYTLNTVDICPVGALTSSDFRFRQRVWYLKTAPSICTGCSTGCNIYVDYNEEGVWRLRPRFNEKENGHWMCDKGRGLYKNMDWEKRLRFALKSEEATQWKKLKSEEAVLQIRNLFQKDSHAFVLTAQYTVEEYQALWECFPDGPFYYWINNKEAFEDFDGLLLRGDKNPNTKGLKKVFPKMKSLDRFEQELKSIKQIFVLAPENPEFYPDLKDKTELFSKAEQLFWLALVKNNFLKPKENFFQIPMKSSFEKEGTYINHQSTNQKVEKIQNFNPQALSIQDFVRIFKHETVDRVKEHAYFKQNQFLNQNKKIF